MVYSFDYELNEVEIYEGKTGKYLLANVKEIAVNFKGLAIGAKNQTVEDLIQYINSLSVKRYTLEELKDLKEAREKFDKKPNKS